MVKGLLWGKAEMRSLEVIIICNLGLCEGVEALLESYSLRVPCIPVVVLTILLQVPGAPSRAGDLRAKLRQGPQGLVWAAWFRQASGMRKGEYAFLGHRLESKYAGRNCFFFFSGLL